MAEIFQKREQLAGTWFQEAAKLMAVEGINLRQAILRLELPVTTEQCAEIFKSAPFQRVYRIEQTRHNKEIALTPGRDKASTVGLMLKLVDKLIDAEEYDKAANVLEKVMKAEGYIGSDQNVNVFTGLTPKDLATLREEIETNKKASAN